jgi:hypothetical protein
MHGHAPGYLGSERSSGDRTRARVMLKLMRLWRRGFGKGASELYVHSTSGPIGVNVVIRMP